MVVEILQEEGATVVSKQLLGKLSTQQAGDISTETVKDNEPTPCLLYTSLAAFAFTGFMGYTIGPILNMYVARGMEDLIMLEMCIRDRSKTS